MPDPRFYETLSPVTLGELAALVGAELADGGAAGRSISGAAPLPTPEPSTSRSSPIAATPPSSPGRARERSFCRPLTRRSRPAVA
jgi:UDP-3-O-[3-hydroxymyristoyl] glucosamine N-acyltransferase